MMKILVVDDERSIVDAVAIGLELQWPGVQIYSAADGEAGLVAFTREAPDLTLLDVNLPRLNGWEVLQRIRATSQAPVILLTARSEELDKVKGLDLGADDYLTKPFSHLELFARIKAVLRRTDAELPGQAPPPFVAGDLRVQFDSREVTVGGQRVQLTPKEYELLYVLVRNAGRILPLETLLQRVWGEAHLGEKDDLKTYISRLRHKLGDDPEQPRYIRTERGVGYRFAPAARVVP